jgi:FkbM family methyltransferase
MIDLKNGIYNAFRHPIQTIRWNFIYRRPHISQLMAAHEVLVKQPYWWLIEDAPSGSVVIDIGAYGGESAIYFAMSERVARVYAYEPMKNSYEVAKRNIENSPFKNKIEISNAAVMDFDGTKNYGVVGAEGGAKLVEGDDTNLATVSLNRILKGKSNVLIKCDTEGAEKVIFNKDVDLSNVRKIVIESHQHLQESVAGVLESKGFKIRTVPEDKGGLGLIYAQKK